MPPTSVTSSGPMARADRSLGPDLARGSMLLAIALANSHFFLEGPAYVAGFPQDGESIDRGVAWLLATFVDERAYPMFGLLFGYGVAQIVRRQASASPRAVRHILWRRSLFLIVAGVLHAVLLFAGDILTAYGVLLLVGAWVVRWRDRWLLIVPALFVVSTAIPLPGEGGVWLEGPHAASMLPTDLGEMVADRLVIAVVVGLLGPFFFAGPFLLGLWAGRRRLLEDPPAELATKRRHALGMTALIGISIAVVGAQPVALIQIGVTEVSASADALFALHTASGFFGGVGYAALLAWVALRIGTEQGRLVTAIAAVGERSMTCYLAQSVVWTIAFTPALLGLSDVLSITGCALLAVVTWLLTVALAEWMRRTGRRGPFEVAARRVTYSSR